MYSLTFLGLGKKVWCSQGVMKNLHTVCFFKVGKCTFRVQLLRIELELAAVCNPGWEHNHLCRNTISVLVPCVVGMEFFV